MTREALDELKRQIPVLDYLHAHNWRPVRQLRGGRWMGLCPLHQDHHPSFVVDPNKGLFYCYGGGRGGDVIRFAEICHEVRFPQAVALLRQWRGLPPLLQDAANFYRVQLHRHRVAVDYLDQRGMRSPEVIDHMRIGYAPGACLRRWLMELGPPLTALSQAGLVTSAGYDAYVHRIIFPLEGNLYGRSISASAPPPRFLPASKGGLYRGCGSFSFEARTGPALGGHVLLPQAARRSVFAPHDLPTWSQIGPDFLRFRAEHFSRGSLS